MSNLNEALEQIEPIGSLQSINTILLAYASSDMIESHNTETRGKLCYHLETVVNALALMNQPKD